MIVKWHFSYLVDRLTTARANFHVIPRSKNHSYVFSVGFSYSEWNRWMLERQT